MKVGTLSLNINTDDFNYGAVLHSWAMQQWLNKQSYIEETEIIDYITPSIEHFNRKYPMISMLAKGRPRAMFRYIIHYRAYKKKLDKFQQFVRNNIKKSSLQYNQETLSTTTLYYDAVICESDVIWSPGFFGGTFDKSFFMAVESMVSLNKIAYAPSLADGDLTREQSADFERLLKSVDHISCRESYAVDIIAEHTNKPVTKVVDPVLLLDSNDYDCITARRQISEPYLFVYLPMDDNEDLIRYAVDYAKQKGLRLVEVSTKLRFHRKDILCITDAGIEEFLSYIKYADVVFTNSFHAICFSLLYKVEFYAFSRSCSKKVRDICETFNLADRFFADNRFIAHEPINYIKVEESLKLKRLYSKQWLEKALNSK